MIRDFRALAEMAARLATGPMGWSPAAFWAATPAEMVLALEGRMGGPAAGAVAPVGRAGLARLLEEMPDG